MNNQARYESAVELLKALVAEGLHITSYDDNDQLSNDLKKAFNSFFSNGDNQVDMSNELVRKYKNILDHKI